MTPLEMLKNSREGCDWDANVVRSQIESAEKRIAEGRARLIEIEAIAKAFDAAIAKLEQQ